jgi:tetratricopeptide (TPR) repeat protein
VDGYVQRVVGSADCSELQMTLYLAESLLRTGQAALAIDYYRWAGAQFTARGEAHHALAVYAVLGQLMPHCLHTQGMAAELHRRLGRVHDAARIYERIAEAHAAQGRIVEAAHVYRLAVEIDPATVSRRVRLADLYARLGQTSLAVLQLEIAAGQLQAGERFPEYVWVAGRLLALRPDDAPTLRGLVRAHLRQGELRAAVAGLQRLLRTRPRDAAGRELLADCLVAHGRRDRAAKALRLLAEEMRRRGVHAYDEAKRLLVRAVQIQPFDRVAHAALRSLELELAAIADRDFTENRITGVIDNVSTAELLAGPQPDDQQTNVVALRRRGVPELTPTQADSPPHGHVIYAQFG